jgi:hypothetical protein
MSYDCKIGGKSLEEEIKKYCKKNECDAEGIMIEMIDKMAEIGETPITWKGIYLMRIDAETDEPNWKMKFINEQSALVGMYKR